MLGRKLRRFFARLKYRAFQRLSKKNSADDSAASLKLALMLYDPDYLKDIRLYDMDNPTIKGVSTTVSGTAAILETVVSGLARNNSIRNALSEMKRKDVQAMHYFLSVDGHYVDGAQVMAHTVEQLKAVVQYVESIDPNDTTTRTSVEESVFQLKLRNRASLIQSMPDLLRYMVSHMELLTKAKLKSD